MNHNLNFPFHFQWSLDYNFTFEWYLWADSFQIFVDDTQNLINVTETILDNGGTVEVAEIDDDFIAQTSYFNSALQVYFQSLFVA